ncbi:hypothetical protein JY651_08980 [Pyxidicoccus parkwayensis]|uniref:DUF4412 domain-containing protein n=1 Tax=Pyxidicoccus parkwayensis TaxID=2813578 RepID=A0ABX7P3N4_9BACT|nr:hypothetical protein [Pyxidicoccus parkwaysis]QSQ25046.1 hypothetical protein JY651_08980 [Pyxidicoccus parkwaysis]
MRALLWVAALLVAAPAGAQMPPAARALMQHMSKGTRAAKVGDWATYRFDGGGLRVFYWRTAVVGEEKDKSGRDAVWVELEAGTHPAMKSPLMQMRMLVAREGDEIRYDAISRLFIGGPFDRPQEYSKEALEHVLKEEKDAQAQAQQARAADAKAPAPAGITPVIRSGKEQRLMTLAGTVTAVPVEVVFKGTVIKRIWVSREIPLMNLVKMEIPGIAHSMEVVEYGIDAKPRMVMPPPDAPKVRLEYADSVLPDLGAAADAEAAQKDSEDTP